LPKKPWGSQIEDVDVSDIPEWADFKIEDEFKKYDEMKAKAW
jgi:hypothetical protein